MGLSVQTAQPERKDSLGPLLCQGCRKLVRWVRRDGKLVLVNAGTGLPHDCCAGCR